MTTERKKSIQLIDFSTSVTTVTGNVASAVSAELQQLTAARWPIPCFPLRLD